MGTGWAVLIILFLLIIVLISRINIRVTYYRKDKDDQFLIAVSALYGLINVKNELNLLKLLINRTYGPNKKGVPDPTVSGSLKELGYFKYAEKALYNYREYITKAERYKNMVKYLKGKVCIKKLKWHTVLGTGDAAITGIAIGFLWIVKTIVSTLLGIDLN